jgi:tetratricopeptide (TPR) repeat protein
MRWEPRRVAFVRSVLTLPPGADLRLDPSRAVEVLVEKARSFGGRVEALGPTGLVAAVGLEPVEDAPRHAALAAVAVQKAAEGGWRRQVEGVGIRSAVHVGQVLVGHGGPAPQIDLEGKRQAWTTLEQLLGAAEPDGVVASDAAAPFLERHFELVPVEVEPLRGRAFRLAAGEPAAAGLPRRLTTFIGRVHELDLLRSRLDLALRGHGQVVGILGNAGIGKSRLLHEFRRSLEGTWLTYLEGRCQSYGSAIPHLPILDILRQNFRVDDADPPDAIAAEVEAGLEELGMEAREPAPYLLQLLGVQQGTEALGALAPGAIKARTFEVLRPLGLQGSRKRPILFVIEDLHWSDATSEECLVSLMDSMVAAPAMLLVTYRPAYRPPWVDKSYVTQIALAPLSPEESLRVARSLLRVEELPPRLSGVILDKTEGNPLFLEELCRAVQEAGELRPAATIPDTVQELLLARIDRLADAPRRLLQAAAVVGREMPLPLLRAVWDGPEPLDATLPDLVRLEFVHSRGGGGGGAEPVYAFAHTLVQEVAYESLPAGRRRVLHAAAARALESLYADRLAEVYDRLAYHYGRTDDADRAVTYLAHLARKAAGAHAHTEAVRILDEGLAHADGLPAAERDRRRLELVLTQVYSLIPLGGFQETVDRLLRHEPALDRLGDPALAGPYHFLIGRGYLFLGDDARASHHARLGIAAAMQSGDAAMLGKVHYVLAQRGALSGRPEEGLEEGPRAVELLTRGDEPWWLGPAHWAVALNHGLRGEFRPALEALARASALADAVGDPQFQSASAWATGIMRCTMGENAEGLAACQRAAAQAPDPLGTAFALGWLGYASLEGGDAAGAIPRLEQAIAQVAEFRFRQAQGWFTVFLAEAHRLEGRLDTAFGLATEGRRIAREVRSTHGLAWAERALGRIAHARGALAEAEAALQDALQTFLGMGARHEAARTRLDLARVAMARHDAERAARLLGEARATFAELDVPRWIDRTDRLADALGQPGRSRPA